MQLFVDGQMLMVCDNIKIEITEKRMLFLALLLYVLRYLSVFICCCENNFTA